MKRWYLLLFIVASLTACNLPDPTPTEPPPPTDTPGAVTVEPSATPAEAQPTHTPLATDTPTPKDTETPETTVTPGPSQTPTATSEYQPFETGELIGNPHMAEWDDVVLVELAPGVDPKGYLEWHTVPSTFEPFYRACNYYTTSTDWGVCVDGKADIIGGDADADLGRPEIKVDIVRGWPKVTAQEFSDGRPTWAGFQTLVAHALPEHTGAICHTLIEVQIWTNPLYQDPPPYNIIEWSKPRWKAEGDDLRVTEFFVFAASNRYFREPEFLVENWYGDPSGFELAPHNLASPFFTYIGVVLDEMPYDRWETYESDLFIPPGQQDLWFGLGYLSRFGWGTNFYIREFSVQCSGMGKDWIAPTQEPTPTPRVPVSVEVIEVEPQGLEANISDVETQDTEPAPFDWQWIVLGAVIVIVLVNSLRSKNMELKDVTPVIGPLLNLLRSRKVLIAIFTLVIDVLVAYVPEFEAVRTELLTIFTLVGSLVIASIAHEDGKAKSAPKA